MFKKMIHLSRKELNEEIQAVEITQFISWKQRSQNLWLKAGDYKVFGSISVRTNLAHLTTYDYSSLI